LSEILLWVLVVLDVLGFSGLIFSMPQRIGALEGTVQAQGNTIKARATQTFDMLRRLMESLEVEKNAGLGFADLTVGLLA